MRAWSGRLGWTLRWKGRDPRSRNPPHPPASPAWAATAAGGPGSLTAALHGLHAPDVRHAVSQAVNTHQTIDQSITLNGIDGCMPLSPVYIALSSTSCALLDGPSARVSSRSCAALTASAGRRCRAGSSAASCWCLVRQMPCHKACSPRPSANGSIHRPRIQTACLQTCSTHRKYPHRSTPAMQPSIAQGTPSGMQMGGEAT